MTLAEKTTHAAQAKAKLIEQFRGKPGFNGLLDSYLAQIQELEGVLFDLLAIVTDQDNQTHAQLDLLGRIIGEKREGKNDATYLQAIKARLIINRASGTTDEIRLMLSQIVPNELGIEEYYPAAFIVRLLDTYTDEIDRLAGWIKEIRAAGVSGCLETTSADDEDTFQFASGDTAESDAQAGFSGMRWVAVGGDAGSQAYIVTSDDLITWTQRTNPNDEQLNRIATDSAGVLIAVGAHDGTDPYVIRSTDDGETWVELDLPDIASVAVSITYSPSLDLWAIVGSDAGAEALILTSDDGGDSWTAQSNPDDATLNYVTWCPSIGLFIAAGDPASGDSYLITSPDGETWTERSHPKNVTINGICWSEDLGLAVAVGAADGADAYILSSPDGINWTERANPKHLQLYDVRWNESLELFVAVGAPDTDSYIVTSPNGIDWTERISPSTLPLYGIGVRGASEFAAVGDVGGGDALVLTSDDTITWTERANPQNILLLGVIGIQRLSLGGTWARAMEA